MASQEVQSIADLQRPFNALWDTEVSYKAFYNQLAKASCASFLLTSLSDIMGKLTMKGLCWLTPRWTIFQQAFLLQYATKMISVV